MIIASVLSTILTFVELFIPIHISLPNWSVRGWLIAFLAMLITLLLLVIEAVYRFHTRVIDERKKVVSEIEKSYKADIDEWKSRLYKIEGLSAVFGVGEHLSRIAYGEPIKHTLEVWLAGIEGAISTRLGTRALIEFRGGSLSPPDVPDSMQEQRAWVHEQTDKLGKLIRELRQEKSVSLQPHRSD